jgi:hypothetical protein
LGRVEFAYIRMVRLLEDSSSQLLDQLCIFCVVRVPGQHTAWAVREYYRGNYELQVVSAGRIRTDRFQTVQ